MQDQMQPQQSDNEGAVAKADLYKLANYSAKLFKKINPEDQLEAWVQAKITKAADYIASVYHYLEYEMEFSDYGHKLDNSDVLSEDQKVELKAKLNEAKEKIKNLKKQQADKISGKQVEEGQEDLKKTGDSYKTSKGGTVTKTSTGVKHERDSDSYTDGGDEVDTMAKSGKGVKSHAKSKSAAEKKAEAPKLKKSKSGTWGMEGGEKFDNRKVAEGAKPDFNDVDNDGDETESWSKAEKDKKKGSTKKVKESAPSADLTKKEKSAVVKKAKKGEDIGKPGKNFDKVAKAAGGGKKGEKIAAAAMWKNIKEAVKSKKSEEEQCDEVQSAVYPSRNKADVGADKTGQVAQGNEPKKPQSSVYPSRNKADVGADKTGQAVMNESTEIDRLKALTQRLNG